MRNNVFSRHFHLVVVLVCLLGVSCGSSAASKIDGSPDVSLNDEAAACDGGGAACTSDQQCCAGLFCRIGGADAGAAPYCSAVKGGKGAPDGYCSQGGESCATDLDCCGALHCAIPAGQVVGACGGQL
ncbi:MAG: hypothetical protein WCG85_01480 [Polyangia bacterium]